MSTFSCPVVKFRLEKHPNADSLSLAHIKGWTCIIRTEDFKNEELGVYIPLDAVADKDHPLLGFLGGKKVKTMKLRGIISQGVLLPYSQVEYHLLKDKKLPKVVVEGDDLHEVLGVKKWEEPVKPKRLGGGGRETYETSTWPSWLCKYTDIENFNNYPDVLQEEELVEATTKIHGTSVIYAKIEGKYYVCSRNRSLRTEDITIRVPKYKSRKLNKFLQRYGLFNNFLFSNPKILPPPKNVYLDVFHETNMKDTLDRLEAAGRTDKVALFGEIANVQKGYHYGLKSYEVKLYAYDIILDKPGKWLCPAEFKHLCDLIGINRVPVNYVGPFSKDVLELRKGKDPLGGNTHWKEGIVIKPLTPRTDPSLGRVVLKVINESYLMDKGKSDF